jgi:S-(hydroxymethyl)glutathione dehydrogenase/alcohol dehydrogenase
MKVVFTPEQGKIEVKDMTLDLPKAGEVKIKMAATGVCHSDLSMVNDTFPNEYPFALGHEGAGIIEEVGEGVTNVKPGDPVILAFVPNCRDCFHCLRGEAYLCEKKNILGEGSQLDGTHRLHDGDTDIPVMCGMGCMAEYVVTPSMCVVPIDPDIPMQVAALVGCAVTTGVGAALNTAKVEPGSSVVVFGCGGVGISIIQGAVLAGAERIIAVDLDEKKLEIAKKFGATHLVKSHEKVVKDIKKLTNWRGADYAFEAIGLGAVVKQAYNSTRNGGTCTVVGMGKIDDTFSFDPLTFPYFAKTLCGCMYGGANPGVDFPKMLNLYSAGKLDLDGMITKTYSIDEAPQAFEDMVNGVNARGVIVYE